VTQKPRIGAQAPDRGSSFGCHRTRAVLGLFLAYLFLCSSALHAQPVTSTYSEVQTFEDPTMSHSGPSFASCTNWEDTSSNSENWFDRSQAQASFGLNRAYSDSEYFYTETPYVSPETAHPTATASYTLNWSTLDHSSSGNILSLSLSLSSLPGSNWITGLHLGSFQFQYGTQYIIQSSLSVYASYSFGGHALANSVWSDTFSIHGQPNGTSGVAGFDVDLNGYLSSSTSEGPPIFNFPQYPGEYNELTADFSNGASLDYVFLPDGASLTTDSGFPAIVTPEPSAAAFLLLTGCGMLLRRRR
jgi:hypothetical protein